MFWESSILNLYILRSCSIHDSGRLICVRVQIKSCNTWSKFKCVREHIHALYSCPTCRIPLTNIYEDLEMNSFFMRHQLQYGFSATSLGRFRPRLNIAYFHPCSREAIPMYNSDIYDTSNFRPSAVSDWLLQVCANILNSRLFFSMEGLQTFQALDRVDCQTGPWYFARMQCTPNFIVHPIGSPR